MNSIGRLHRGEYLDLKIHKLGYKVDAISELYVTPTYCEQEQHFLSYKREVVKSGGGHAEDGQQVMATGYVSRSYPDGGHNGIATTPSQFRCIRCGETPEVPSSDGRGHPSFAEGKVPLDPPTVQPYLPAYSTSRPWQCHLPLLFSDYSLDHGSALAKTAEAFRGIHLAPGYYAV